MKPEIAHAIARELVSRGYTTDGTAPNGTMSLDEPYMRSVSLGDLLDQLVARREKIFRSVEVVGQDAASKSYDDVVVAIDVVKAVVSRLDLS